jgi:PAS domain S-box-containing protein
MFTTTQHVQRPADRSDGIDPRIVDPVPDGVRVSRVSPPADVPAGALHAALMASRDAVVCIGPDGGIVLCNGAAEERFGVTDDEIRGKPFDLLFPGAGPELFGPAAAPAAAAGGSITSWRERVLTGRCSDGSTSPLRARIVPAETAAGAFLTLILQPEPREVQALAELSLLKSMALAIGASADLDTALELSLQQIGTVTGWSAGESWLPDGGGEWLRRGPVWSRAESRLGAFHLASEAMVFRRSEGLPGRAWAAGTAVWIDDVSSDPGFVRAAFARECGLRAGFAIPVLAGDEVVAVIVFYHTERRGQDAVLLDLVATVAAQLGTLILRKQAEDELLRRSEELARSNAELEQFAYVASHDLQEPLRMVASYTQLLERRYGDRLDADAREFIGFAVEGVTRMKQLILDLLAFSRVGTRGAAFQPVDLDEVVDEIVREFGSPDAEQDVRITAAPLPRLSVDASQMRQVFRHLVGNAVKFRREEPLHVRLSAERSGDEWVFACRDNGIGIAAEYFERIFVIFQRLHHRGEYDGNGIGLSICRKIVERHGGRIWVESEPGRGSTFRFTLPAERAQTDAEASPRG